MEHPGATERQPDVCERQPVRSCSLARQNGSPGLAANPRSATTTTSRTVTQALRHDTAHHGTDVDNQPENNYSCRARIVASARKHRVTDADVEHALTNYMRVYEDSGEVAMFIGPAIDGTVLEIGVVLDDEDPRVIHAMRARAKYWP